MIVRFSFFFKSILRMSFVFFFSFFLTPFFSVLLRPSFVGWHVASCSSPRKLILFWVWFGPLFFFAILVSFKYPLHQFAPLTISALLVGPFHQTVWSPPPSPRFVRPPCLSVRPFLFSRSVHPSSPWLLWNISLCFEHVGLMEISRFVCFRFSSLDGGV